MADVFVGPCNVKTSVSLSHTVLQHHKMLSTLFPLKLSTTFLKPLNPNPKPKKTQLSHSSSSTRLNHNFIHGSPRKIPTYAFSSSCFKMQVCGSFLVSNQRNNSVKVRAASVPENTADTVKPSGVIKTLQLGFMFVIWYILNICFNIYNKQVHHLYLYLQFSFSYNIKLDGSNSTH